MFKDKPYWSTFDPQASTAGSLATVIRSRGFPRDGKELQDFAAWWNKIPMDVIHEMAQLDVEIVFEVMACVRDPLFALDLYKRRRVVTLETALATAERTGAQLQNQLREASKQLSCRELDILQLKAEIYDLTHKKEAK